MTEQIVVSKEHDSFFREACKDSKIDFELTGEGIDGDSYTVKFDRPSELYYLGRHVDLLVRLSYSINPFNLK